MSEKWTDGRDHYAMPDDDLVAHHLREQRVADSQPRAPEQRGASVEQTASENQRDIAKLQSQLDELRAWVQERADGVSNLGMRVAKLEDGGCNASFLRDDVLRHQIAEVRAQAEKDRTWTRDLIATWRKELGHRIDEERRAWQDADVSLLRVHGPVHLRLNEDMQANLSRLDQLEAHAQRVCKQFPQVATQTTEEDNRV